MFWWFLINKNKPSRSNNHSLDSSSAVGLPSSSLLKQRSCRSSQTLLTATGGNVKVDKRKPPAQKPIYWCAPSLFCRTQPGERTFQRQDDLRQAISFYSECCFNPCAGNDLWWFDFKCWTCRLVEFRYRTLSYMVTEEKFRRKNTQEYTAQRTKSPTGYLCYVQIYLYYHNVGRMDGLMSPLQLKDQLVVTQDKVCDLGVILDSTLMSPLWKHTQQTSSAAIFKCNVSGVL